MANPSTIWAQLALPNPAAGSIPFVATDNMTIVTDVSNISYNPTTHQLTLAEAVQHAYGTTAAGAVGQSVTNNNPSGRVVLPAGASILTVLNNNVSATAIVFVEVEGNDATATFKKSVVPGLGQFVVTMNAAATGNLILSFLVVNS